MNLPNSQFLKTNSYLLNYLELVCVDDLAIAIEQLKDVNTAGVVGEIEGNLIVDILLFEYLFTHEVVDMKSESFLKLAYFEIDIRSSRVRIELAYFGTAGLLGKTNTSE